MYSTSMGEPRPVIVCDELNLTCPRTDSVYSGSDLSLPAPDSVAHEEDSIVCVWDEAGRPSS